ncbi:alanine racemase [Candidatus Kapabacteria bacterium]|nr:alanine racemase [Candidatus Kapabacteria bacterium]
MAELRIHPKKIQENIKSLSNYFAKHDIEWSLITKVFSGDKEFLKNVLTPNVIEQINSVGDSRLSSLKNLKEVNPDIRTIYIKPPAKIYADELVKYADISLNSSFSTIEALNNAAKKANKTHDIIIMIELGELREGIERDQILEFYEKVFNFSNIEVIGIGSNLGCMYGVEPTYDKLLQLALYKQLISSKFNVKLPFISGGTSITLPLLESGTIPKGINHFRVGEAAFFGLSPLKNERFLDLHTDTFDFFPNIIELEEKKIVPDGIISDASIGHTIRFDDDMKSHKSFKAILDFGLLDVDQHDLSTKDDGISFVGVTSDMIVLDIGDNKTEDGVIKYQTGDKVHLTPNYMAVARLLGSKFIDKKYV